MSPANAGDAVRTAASTIDLRNIATPRTLLGLPCKLPNYAPDFVDKS
jgi:hypothetical protein